MFMSDQMIARGLPRSKEGLFERGRERDQGLPQSPDLDGFFIRGRRLGPTRDRAGPMLARYRLSENPIKTTGADKTAYPPGRNGHLRVRRVAPGRASLTSL